MLQGNAGRNREVYGPTLESVGPTLLSELEMLGWARFPRAQVHGLGPHRHTAYEICYIVDGGVTWWVGDDAFEVKRGDIFFTRPDEWHGGVDEMMHPCDLYWLQLHPDMPTAPLCRALDSDGPRCFSVPAAADAFTRLFQEHRQNQPFPILAARSALHALLVTVVRARAAGHPGRPLGTGDAERLVSPPIARALEWMTARLNEPFIIQDVASAIGMNASRFHERFLQEVGQTPAEWRVRQRIAAARQMLRDTEMSVTEVAFALGFASSQYFATAFKKYTGRTPSEYRTRMPTDF